MFDIVTSAIKVLNKDVLRFSKQFYPLKMVLAVLGVPMKIWMLFLFSSIPLFAYSNNDIAAKKEIDLFLKVSECLRNIPHTEINKKEHKTSKELSLITSVIENITMELGTNDNEQIAFRELYKVANQHCSKEIGQLKAEYKYMLNKQISQGN